MCQPRLRLAPVAAWLCQAIPVCKGVFGALSAMRQEQARLTKTVMAFSSALTAQKQEAHLTACAQAVDDAITAGKIPPAHRAYHFSAAKRDLEAFNAFVAKCQPFPGFVQKNSQKGGTKDTANKSPFDVALKRV
ncbi:hypothetical protein FACS189441_5590 [Betaproteobacteria bacterium]|nr:hypothetical protein FACS189441_5590 [Betaproteobacteria bacterium]